MFALKESKLTDRIKEMSPCIYMLVIPLIGILGGLKTNLYNKKSILLISKRISHFKSIIYENFKDSVSTISIFLFFTLSIFNLPYFVFIVSF